MILLTIRMTMTFLRGTNMNYKFRLKTFSAALEDPTPYACGSPREAVSVLRAIYKDCSLDDCQEHFLVMVLNAKGAVMGYKVVGTGTETGVMVTPAIVFRAALVLGGLSVIICHNHPSGDPEPSREDKHLTDRCRKSGEALGLPLADHIILGRDTMYSFRAAEGWYGNSI